MGSEVKSVIGSPLIQWAMPILKSIQVALAIICMGLLRYYNLNFGGEQSQVSSLDRYIFGVITIGGMLIVTIPILIVYIFGSEIRPGLDLIYSTMGFVFFLTAGIMALDNYVVYRNRPGNLNAGRSLGAIMIIDSSFFLLNAVASLSRIVMKD